MADLSGKEAEVSSKEHRWNWTRLIQKMYKVDRLLCPKFQGPIHITSFIEIKRSLKII